MSLCSQEDVHFSALSDKVFFPKAIVNALTELHVLVDEEIKNQVPTVLVQVSQRVTWHPRFDLFDLLFN